MINPTNVIITLGLAVLFFWILYEVVRKAVAHGIIEAQEILHGKEKNYHEK